MASNVTKIYELRTLGYDDTIKQIANIEKAFRNVNQAKKDLNAIKSKTEDPAELRVVNEQLEEQRLKTAELRLERQKLLNDAKALQVARQAEINQNKITTQANNAEAGSIKAIRLEISQLNAQVIGKNSGSGTPIEFKGQILTYQQAIDKLKQLTAAEQEFRRQFAADRTLVGEYTTGIIQAFKTMGLEDLVGGQATKAAERLKVLNTEFDHLKSELNQMKAAGAGSLDALEKDLIDNRAQAILLEKEINRLNTELRGTGDIGSQVTSSIGKGFQSLKGSVSSFLLGFVGIQAVFSGIRRTIDDTIQLDSLDTAMVNVSRTQGELRINQEFLAKTTNQLGLELQGATRSYKNFYAASTLAGISAKDTRDIYFSASAAAANLKLSQEDTNGVLLAFGQIASKGKVQAEELRGQIGERIPGAFAIAAKAIGVTQQQLNKMLENGEVIASDFLPKFGAELRKTFGGDTTKNVNGLQASINRLKNEFTQFLKDNKDKLTAFVSGLIAVGSALFSLLNFLPAIITLLGLLAGAWAINNAGMIANNIQLLILRGQLLGYNILLAGSRVIMVALSIAQAAYNAVLAVYTGVTTRAAGATILLANATRLLGFGAILTVIGLLVGVFRAFGAEVTNTAAGLRELARQQQIDNEIRTKANELIGDQVSKLESLVRIVTSSAVSYDTSRAALDKLVDANGKFSAALKDNVIDLEEVKRIMGEVRAEIFLNANAEAAASLSADKYKDLLKVVGTRQKLEESITSGQKPDLNADQRAIAFNVPNEAQLRSISGDLIIGGIRYDSEKYFKALKVVEDKALVSYEDFNKRSAKYQQEQIEKAEAEAKKNAAAHPTGAAGRTIDLIKADLKKANEDFDKAIIGSKDKQELEAKIKKLNAELKAAQIADDKPAPRQKASRLTADQTDKLRDIDAIRDTLLAQQKQARLLDEIDEEKYLQNILKINSDAIDKKLALLKGNNAQERKVIAELKLEKISEAQDTADKIFAIQKEQLKNQLENNIASIKEKDAEVQQDPVATATAKAQSKLDADRAILALQVAFAARLDALEKALGQNSVKNAQETAEAIRKIKTDVLKDEGALTEASLRDQQASGEKLLQEFKLRIAEMRNAVANSNASPAKKQIANQAIDDQEKIGILAREVGSARANLPLYKNMLDEKKITETQYMKFVEELKVKETALANLLGGDLEKAAEKITGIGDLIRTKLKSILNFDTSTQKGRDQAQLFADTISQTYQFAAQAMENYYSQEAQLIERSRRIQQEKLDIELKQQLDRAQSQAEREAIEKQFAQKKDQADREAFEKNKKIQLAQAKVSLAISLANLAVIAFAPNPLNIATLGAAGAIMYGIQAALILGSYALNVNRIKSAQYEFGGQPDQETTRGGRVKGRSHSQGGNPFMFKGRVFEDEVDELNIIRTKNAPRNKIFNVVGTQAQIASKMNVIGGGVEFEPGATIRRFASGGSLGDSLQAPVFTPAFSNTFISSDSSAGTIAAISELGNRVLTLADEQSKRIDRMEVVLDPNKVTKAQKKQEQQTEIATF